ncbi:MAG TPA: pseudouridine synthase, partial [Burkholderiaceae bacterium]|nr:pseudouridine synthase [Burkholderiaceae bacterium]
LGQLPGLERGRDRSGHGDRPGRPARPPRGEPADRPARAERPDRPDRPVRSDHPERSDRPSRPGPGPGPGPEAGRTDRGPRAGAGRPPRDERRPPERAPEHPPQRPRAEGPAGEAPEGERLSKRMTALGLASRREADEWIEAGWVRVNGKLAVLGQRVGPEVQITIDPAAHREQAQRVTILLHKPIGYVSGQAEDGYEPASVLVRPENRWAEDKEPRRWHVGQTRGLAPAGRLDIDSTGLLVLTQDGRIAKQLIGDDSTVEKEYLVRVRYTRASEEQPRLPDADLALLQHGLSLDGVALRPAKVSWANEDQLRFVLREGRKRQIRRMCEAVGLEVLGLKRVRIGSVPLGHLPPGQWRYLRRDEFFA